MINREEILEYVKNKYNVDAEYPLPSAPFIPVMRHHDNRKWFALIVEVEKAKIGLSGQDHADLINVKMPDSMLAEILIGRDGFFKGYPISRGSWISILLDGTVPLEEVCRCIDESYKTTASTKVRQKIRPPKEWIIPANPKYYDIMHAFDKTNEIEWKQGRGIKNGDTVYLYVAAPVSAILYKCQVTETDIPCKYHDGSLIITALMKIKLLSRYGPSEFTYSKMKEMYGIYAVRGPRFVPDLLSDALNR